MKEFEVHFLLSSSYVVEANNGEEAEDIVNNIINSRIREIEYLLNTGVEDSAGYVADVIELGDVDA